jgi:hypothetical protein
MQITKENYEAYILDYYEGSLNTSQVRELMDFLSQNPELREEFESFEMLTLEQVEQQEFASKELLKKTEYTSITADNFEHFCIAFLEGDLDSTHQQAFHAYLSTNPDMVLVFDLYKKARLNETQIEFPGKQALKKVAVGNQSSLENAIIAYHEGDLSEQQKKEVLTLVAHDGEAATDFYLIKKARLAPSLEVVYQGKEDLKKHIFAAPVFRQLWHYGAAAAVIVFIISLVFLLPQPGSEPQMGQNNPEIIVSPQPPVDFTIPLQVAEQPIATKQPTLDEKHKVAQQEEIPSNFPRPMQLAQLPTSGFRPLDISPATNVSQIEERTEFAYWAMRGEEWYTLEEDEEEEITEPRRNTSFASLAYNGLERTTGIDLAKVEDRISNSNFSIWDIAGAGLAGLSQITNTSLNIEKERDDDGRITSFAIGDVFRISR